MEGSSPLQTGGVERNGEICELLQVVNRITLLLCHYLFCPGCRFLVFRPDPNVLLFRRRLGTDPLTGKVDPEAERAAKAEYAEALAASRR